MLNYRVRTVLLWILLLITLDGQVRTQRRIEQAQGDDTDAQLASEMTDDQSEENPRPAMDASNEAMQEDSVGRHFAPGPSYEMATWTTWLFGLIFCIELLAIGLLGFYIYQLRKQIARCKEVITLIMNHDHLGKSNPTDMQMSQFVDSNLSLSQTDLTEMRTDKPKEKKKTPKTKVLSPGSKNVKVSSRAGNKTKKTPKTPKKKQVSAIAKSPNTSTKKGDSSGSFSDQSSSAKEISETVSLKIKQPTSKPLSASNQEDKAKNNSVSANPISGKSPSGNKDANGKSESNVVPALKPEGTITDGKTKNADPAEGKTGPLQDDTKSTLFDPKLGSTTRRSSSATEPKI